MIDTSIDWSRDDFLVKFQKQKLHFFIFITEVNCNKIRKWLWQLSVRSDHDRDISKTLCVQWSVVSNLFIRSSYSEQKFSMNRDLRTLNSFMISS
jgi:hypothetical protein